VREALLQEIREEPSYVDGGGDGTDLVSFTRDAFDVKTPYGDVIRTARIDGTEIHICHPASILWHFANISADFATMCGDCCTTVNKIAVWTDEVVSGNVLRPDTANKYAVYFWTSLSWPAYVRLRDALWTRHANFFLPTKNIPSGWSPIKPMVFPSNKKSLLVGAPKARTGPNSFCIFCDTWVRWLQPHTGSSVSGGCLWRSSP
jgi:hypothetical protein